MKDINRRQFITTAGLSAAALSVFGLAGCSGLGANAGSASASADSAIPETWDEEADFVVLGTGTALTGALKAAADGMSVIVLEKAKTIGGTTALSGGQVWVPCNDFSTEKDDRNLAKKYMTKVAAGLSTEAIIDAYIDRASEMVNFIAEKNRLRMVRQPSHRLPCPMGGCQPRHAIAFLRNRRRAFRSALHPARSG